MSMITVIGRGHSGTRIMSHTLSESGVFMGSPITRSGDLIPAEKMYKACRVMAQYVHWKGELEWDWDNLHRIEIPFQFIDLIHAYLRSVLESADEHKGWKIPETTLIFPWIVRMFPEIKYIFWIRNPRDCILDDHMTDDLSDFGIKYPPTEDERLRRAISWKYQFDIVKATPKPDNWLEIRFEDFVLHQDKTLARLEDYLSMKLAKIPVWTYPIDQWSQDEGVNYYDFFASAMTEYEYEIPNKEK